MYICKRFLFSPDVLKSPKCPDICEMNVSRGFRFYIKNHVTLDVFRKEKSAYAISREARGVIPISRKMEKQAKIPSGEGADVYPSSSIHQFFSLFSILFRDSGGSKKAGVRIQRRSSTENRLDVSPATRRNSRRAAEKRNSLRNPPCVYVFTEAVEILRGNK